MNFASLVAAVGSTASNAPPIPTNAITHEKLLNSTQQQQQQQQQQQTSTASASASASASSTSSFAVSENGAAASSASSAPSSSTSSSSHTTSSSSHHHHRAPQRTGTGTSNGNGGRGNVDNSKYRSNDRVGDHRSSDRSSSSSNSNFVKDDQPLSQISPPPYPVVANKTLPKYMYSRQFLLKVARQSRLLASPPPNILPELLRPSGDVGPVSVPAVPAGTIPRQPTKLGRPGVREIESVRDRHSERDARDTRDRGYERTGPPPPTERRWNDPERERERERRERDRESNTRRDGTHDAKSRYESTPSWAHEEVKSTLDTNDDDTFGSAAMGEFVLGQALDRDADARIMQQNGWGQMFRAKEEDEKRLEAEREEIRRRMQEEEQDNQGMSDFTELPEHHPLMMQKAAAAAAAAALKSPQDIAALASNASGDDDLAKLDELLAQKAAADKKGKSREAALDEETFGSVAATSSGHAWSGAQPMPSQTPPDETSGTSKFASRFGFGLQDDSTGVPSVWGGGGGNSGAPISGSNVGPAPGVNSNWGYEQQQVDPSLSQQFSSMPNTIQPTSKLPPGYRPVTAAPPVQPELAYVKVPVNDIFSNFNAFGGGNANPLPTMPTSSTAPLTPAAAAAVVAEDPLQRLVSKHRNRKATAGPPMAHPTNTQILPQHLLTHQHMVPAGGVGAPPPNSLSATGVPNTSPPGMRPYDVPPPSASSAQSSLLSNPEFLKLPPHQQQQYIKHWESQQQQQQQQQLQNARLQQQSTGGVPLQSNVSIPSHYVSVGRTPQSQPNYANPAPPPGAILSPNQLLAQQHQAQQQQLQQQLGQGQGQVHQLPPGMVRRQPPPGVHAQPSPPQHYTQVPLPQQQQQQQHHQGQSQQHMQQSQHQHHQLYQPPPISSSHPMVHGRPQPNLGVVPTTYSMPPSHSQQQQQQQQHVTGGGGAADGGENISRWFSHLQQQPLPSMPSQQHTAHQYYTKVQPQPMQHRQQ